MSSWGCSKRLEKRKRTKKKEKERRFLALIATRRSPQLAVADSSICSSLHSTRRQISHLWARGQRIRWLEGGHRIWCVGGSKLVDGGSGVAGSSHSWQ
jgi:hypothetical protein